MGNACRRPGQQDQIDLEALRTKKRAPSADGRDDFNGYGGGSMHQLDMNGGMYQNQRSGSIHQKMNN